jgi:DMSO/TMAO reductase YedYZ molybdopterin-dependent catalytic subunit
VSGINRRGLLAGLTALGAGACSDLHKTDTAQDVFRAAEDWHRAAHRILAGRERLAPEYAPDQRSPDMRGNGSLTVDSAFYRDELASGFPGWRLQVTGLVDRPMSLTLDDIRALPQRIQMTRHDCVEGWSAIAEWRGPQLGTLLDQAGLQKDANFIVFRCADELYDRPYYESIDLIDAYHPQTIIAHEMNGAPLPEKNGAPLRLRVERHLGYKHAKYLTAIEAVASLDDIAGGKGGFWEDLAGYQWYAGI